MSRDKTTEARSLRKEGGHVDEQRTITKIEGPEALDSQHSEWGP
jgi:hypothetical protein